MEETQTAKSGYGKRPLWQWIVLYLIIAVILYGAIYYLFMHNKNPYSSNSSANPYSGSQMQQPTQAMQQSVSNNVFKFMNKDKLGIVMTDPKGMTLYTFANDKPGVSNCTAGKCLQNWPPYTAQSETGTFPADISVIKRSDGTLQYAYKGMPLYYFTKDKDSGDAYGNGVGNVWSVIKQ